MDSDDEAPPDLINTVGEEIGEELNVKVPITIVTGSVGTPPGWNFSH